MGNINHKRFLYAFRITKMIIFEVDYGAIESNKSWHFATSATKFVKNKKDWECCGQCQAELLKGTIAFNFWKKWDCLHLQNLTTKQYQELLEDIEDLKKKYKYIYKDKNYNSYSIPFSELKSLSMEK